MHPYIFDGLTVLFPFEAYQCQIDYMKAVVECLVKVRKIVLLLIEKNESFLLIIRDKTES